MTIRIQKILLPTDFSDDSTAATIYACELASKFDAELHILHTLEHHLTSTPEFALGLSLPTYISESKAAVEAKLSSLLDSSWSAGRTVVRAVIDGAPKEEIVRYARKKHIDLIVLSTHGRTGLSHVLLGSVAESVVRNSPCPVLTVRPKDRHVVMP
jgi:universal stress protein A